MRFLRSLFPKKADQNMVSFTPKEMCAAVYLITMKWAAETAKDLIKTMTFENKIIEEEKLMFDLSIPFIFEASTCVCDNPRWDKAFQTEIMDGVCDLFFEDLSGEASGKPRTMVDAEIFVRDMYERNLIRNEIQRVSDYNMDKLPKTSLYTLATYLFNKRFSEYQELWKLDMKNLDTPGYLPKMSQKVYEHWSGKDPHVHPESLVFFIPLYEDLAKFSLELSKQLLKMVIK